MIDIDLPIDTDFKDGPHRPARMPMNAKQWMMAKAMAWVLVIVGPVSALALAMSQGWEMDSVNMILAGSMMLPTIFGVAVLLILRRIPVEDSEISP